MSVSDFIYESALARIEVLQEEVDRLMAEPKTQTERRLDNLELAVDTLADMLVSKEVVERDDYDTIESILQGKQNREELEVEA